MITAKKMIVPRTEDVKCEAIQILINNLGITKAAFFIKENLSQKTDYLAIKKQIFAEKTAAEIYQEIKKSEK